MFYNIISPTKEKSKIIITNELHEANELYNNSDNLLNNLIISSSFDNVLRTNENYNKNTKNNINNDSNKSNNTDDDNRKKHDDNLKVISNNDTDDINNNDDDIKDGNGDNDIKNTKNGTNKNNVNLNNTEKNEIQNKIKLTNLDNYENYDKNNNSAKNRLITKKKNDTIYNSKSDINNESKAINDNINDKTNKNTKNNLINIEDNELQHNDPINNKNIEIVKHLNNCKYYTSEDNNTICNKNYINNNNDDDDFDNNKNNKNTLTNNINKDDEVNKNDTQDYKENSFFNIYRNTIKPKIKKNSIKGSNNLIEKKWKSYKSTINNEKSFNIIDSTFLHPSPAINTGKSKPNQRLKNSINNNSNNNSININKFYFSKNESINSFSILNKSSTESTKSTSINGIFKAFSKENTLESNNTSFLYNDSYLNIDFNNCSNDQTNISEVINGTLLNKNIINDDDNDMENINNIKSVNQIMNNTNDTKSINTNSKYIQNNKNKNKNNYSKINDNISNSNSNSNSNLIKPQPPLQQPNFQQYIRHYKIKSPLGKNNKKELPPKSTNNSNYNNTLIKQNISRENSVSIYPKEKRNFHSHYRNHTYSFYNPSIYSLNEKNSMNKSLSSSSLFLDTQHKHNKVQSNISYYNNNDYNNKGIRKIYNIYEDIQTNSNTNDSQLPKTYLSMKSKRKHERKKSILSISSSISKGISKGKLSTRSSLTSDFILNNVKNVYEKSIDKKIKPKKLRNSIENLENSIKLYNTVLQKKIDINSNSSIVTMNSFLSTKNNKHKNVENMNLYELFTSQLIHNNLSQKIIKSIDTGLSPTILKKGRNLKNINNPLINDSNFKNCIRIFIGTWNMMGRSPPPNITPFINISNENYHIVAIGTQECGKNITEAMIFPSCEEWEIALQKHLTKKYQMIKSEIMGPIHLAIFVNKECISHVKNPKSYNVKTGVANVMTNKGAIGISLQFDALTFLFVNSHLTAYQNKISDRNEDYKRISKGLHMNLNNFNYDQNYDYIFWFGDLNYRINGIRSIVDKLIKENQLEVLLANDQLRIEMNKGNTFNNFLEAPITFWPTYKFDVNIKNEISNEATATEVSNTKGKVVSSLSSNPNLLNNNAIPNTDNITTSTKIASNPNIKPFNATDSNNINSNNNETLIEQSSTQLSLSLPSALQSQTSTQELNIYDTSKKARIPSWTDRILFRVRHQKPPASKNEFYLPYQNQSQNNLFDSTDNTNTNINTHENINISSNTDTYTNEHINSNSNSNSNSNLNTNIMINSKDSGQMNVTTPNSMNSIRIPLKPVLVEKYTSCENMHWSDHKPVIGSFRIENDWSDDDNINNKTIHGKTNKACIIQ